jgi:cytochrome P450
MKSMSEQTTIEGLNGVAVKRREAGAGAGFRTYEVHQRERVGESTALVKPGQFLTSDFARDPYPLLAILREHYPSYRNWVTNDYWITRYDDVTSVFADDANFETRPRRWYYALDDIGEDLGQRLPVLQSQASWLDAQVGPVSARIVGELAAQGGGDLAVDFAARLPLELLVGWLALPDDAVEPFVSHYLVMQQGYGWEGRAREAGRQSLHALVALLRPLVEQRRSGDGDDLISVVAREQATRGGPAQAEDLVVTLLERDHETLHGGLANLCYLLLMHPEQLALVRADRLMLKFAWLETLRHSAPVLFAQRFAKHEVERFGKLLPEGALLMCAAAAANRDPRIFARADEFDARRKDLCQREPRGQYRADGLASGIAFGLGKPSRFPAVPEDRPRSLYAITRDCAVVAMQVLLEAAPGLRIAGVAEAPRCQRLQGMHCSRRIEVRF